MSKITLGLRSSAGRKRLQVSSVASGAQLRNEIQRELGLEEDFVVRRDKNGRPGDEVKLSRSFTVAGLRLKSGDALYITPLSGTRFKVYEEEEESTVATAPGDDPTRGPDVRKGSSVQEDPVDVVLSKLDGRIEQSPSANCMHKSESQKCLYCTSLEPFDEEYLRKGGVKHMSFHSYIRKLSSGIDRGKYAVLEDVSCKIRPGCGNHRPWPHSICSACTPPAITLNRQKYRHVDNLMFENSKIVDTFLSYWRATGNQRIGYLYGTYEVFPDVPLGIKARVVAIYEPPQECARDSVRLVKDGDEEEKVASLAAQLGLTKLGWIFTDLLQDSKGKIKHIRNSDSHFLSAQECIMAGNFQSRHPNACKLSSSGYFGSKFVTVVVTGNAENQVHMEGYQVSNQCMALVRDGCLIPTRDAPELGYVRESTSERYVPDVFYKEKDKYGNEVTKVARPLPVEYLLVDVPVAAPKKPQFTFYYPDKGEPFPVENRPMEGHLQDFTSLASYRKRVARISDFFRDFHLLLYLATQTVSQLSAADLKPLLQTVKEGKEDGVLAWSNSEQWQTIELLLEAHNGGYQ